MRGPISFQRISTLAFLTCLVITLTTLFKSAMELEDAEQAYYSQWFRLGYDDQPPFYTWLQIAMNRVFGVTNISFSLLRGLLFAGVLLVVYALARERGNSPERSKLSVLLLVLILVFIDFTFRRLSHTTLLCLTVVATCVIVQRLLRNASIWNYLFFGALMGLGMMSKYNYVFFILGFLVVSLWDASLRTVIWQPKILVSLLVFILMLSPHGYWLWIHGPYQEVLQGSMEDKMNSGWSSHTVSVFPVLRFALGLFAMFFLMVGVVLLLWYRKQLQFTKSPSSWLHKLLWVQLVVMAVFFLGFQSEKVETRWLLPLFLPCIVLLLESVTLKNPTKLVSVGFWVFYLMIAAQFIRTPIEKLIGIPSSVHFGFSPIMDELMENYPDQEWVLLNVTYAGNVRLLHPSKMVYASDDYSVALPEADSKARIRVALDPPDNAAHQALDSIIGFGKEKENLYFYKGLWD